MKEPIIIALINFTGTICAAIITALLTVYLKKNKGIHSKKPIKKSGSVLLIIIVIGIIISLSSAVISYKKSSVFVESHEEDYEKLFNSISELQEQNQYLLEILNKRNLTPTDKNIESENFQLCGIVQSEEGESIRMAKIEIIGGSTVYSTTDGTFKIYCMPGQRITIQKEGYENKTISVNRSMINKFQTIILKHTTHEKK